MVGDEGPAVCSGVLIIRNAEVIEAQLIMQEVEDKTGLIRRFEGVRGHLDAISKAAGEIKTINARRYEDPRLTELAELIGAEAAALKE